MTREIVKGDKVRLRYGRSPIMHVTHVYTEHEPDAGRVEVVWSELRKGEIVQQFDTHLAKRLVRVW